MPVLPSSQRTMAMLPAHMLYITRPSVQMLVLQDSSDRVQWLFHNNGIHGVLFVSQKQDLVLACDVASLCGSADPDKRKRGDQRELVKSLGYASDA
jgi:hypothetical protein